MFSSTGPVGATDPCNGIDRSDVSCGVNGSPELHYIVICVFSSQSVPEELRRNVSDHVSHALVGDLLSP